MGGRWVGGGGVMREQGCNVGSWREGGCEGCDHKYKAMSRWRKQRLKLEELNFTLVCYKSFDQKKKAV